MLLRRAAPATSLRLPTAALRRAPDACGAWAPARGKKEEAAKGKAKPAKPAKATKAKKKDADERAAKYRKQGRIVEDDLDDEEEDYPTPLKPAALQRYLMRLELLKTLNKEKVKDTRTPEERAAHQAIVERYREGRRLQMFNIRRQFQLRIRAKVAAIKALPNALAKHCLEEDRRPLPHIAYWTDTPPTDGYEVPRGKPIRWVEDGSQDD